MTAALLLLGCPDNEFAFVGGTELLEVELEVAPPTLVAPVALELTVRELQFHAEGASASSRVDTTFTPLLRSEWMTLSLEGGSYRDGVLSLVVAADEGPALIFAATRDDDLIQIHVEAVTVDLPLDPLEVGTGPVELTILLHPDEWVVEGVDGLVDPSSGELYDQVLEAIRSSTELQGLDAVR